MSFTGSPAPDRLARQAPFAAAWLYHPPSLFALAAVLTAALTLAAHFLRAAEAGHPFTFANVAALITDGVVRDLEGVLGTGLPVWCKGTAAPPSVAGLTFVAWDQPIGCGGVAVFPDDVIVADRDGAVVIPAALLDHVLAEGPRQEAQEAWIVDEVKRGEKLPGLYPMNAETKVRYEAFLAGKR